MRHGGRIIVDHLKSEGVSHVFCVPGESFLAALDGLHGSGITTVICRQEGGAAMMAEAWGKLTGRPGVAFATRGPGATNASAGVHVARHDSTPMLLFLGQVDREARDRDAFQEVDFPAMFAPLAKWAAEIDVTARLPEYLSRAFHAAQSGRPGPVVLSLPEDMLAAEADVPDAPPANPAVPAPSPEAVAMIAEEIEASARPLLVVGGSGWSAAAAADLAHLAESFDLPVAASFRRQDRLDNRHPSYAGELGIAPNPKLVQRFREADLLILLGARLGEVPSQGYGLLTLPRPGVRLVHIHPDPDEIGRLYRADIAVAAGPAAFARALAGIAPVHSPERAAWRQAARADYEAWVTPEPTPGALRLERVVAETRAALPDDAVVTNGAGNYAGFVNRYFAYHRHGTQLAPTSGSMGYGLPAAIAAKLHRREREVVTFAGDGCFLMTGQELATAVAHGAGIVVVVCDNGMYGTIRMHQERRYPGRVEGTALRNPDFAAYAESFGALGLTVAEDAAYADALAAARDVARRGRPALIHCRLDPEAITTRQTLSAIREAAEAGAGR